MLLFSSLDLSPHSVPTHQSPPPLSCTAMTNATVLYPFARPICLRHTRTTATSAMEEEQSELRIYNSMTNEKEIFKPKLPGYVSIYVCGVTAYDYSHFGNAPTAVSFDILFRYTELEIAVPEIGIVGLHMENLGIESVWVDGEPTEFEYYSHHQQQSEDENRWSTVDSHTSAADVAGSVYLSSLKKELVPNLLINCCKPFNIDSEQQERPLSENGFPSSAKAKQENLVP